MDELSCNDGVCINMTEVTKVRFSFVKVVLTKCCHCLHLKHIKVRVLPASEHKKMSMNSMRSSGIEDSAVGFGSFSKRVVLLNLPRTGSKTECEQQPLSHRKDSTQSVPNKPLEEYVFPRTPRNAVMKQETQ